MRKWAVHARSWPDRHPGRHGAVMFRIQALYNEGRRMSSTREDHQRRPYLDNFIFEVMAGAQQRTWLVFIHLSF